MKKLSLGVVATAASVLSAAPTTFYGLDAGVNPTDARPRSDAARDRFLNAAGAVSTLTYDDLSTTANNTSAKDVGLGVLMSVSGNMRSGIRSTPGSASNGFRTSGANRFFLSDTNGAMGGTPVLTIDFSAPVDSFGSYFTGLSTAGGNTLTLTYSDGGIETLSLSGALTGGSLYFGFIDTGRSISRLRIESANSGDNFSLDDTSFGLTSAPIPLPTASAMGLAGLALVGFGRRRST